jgi:hypothetical protein
VPFLNKDMLWLLPLFLVGLVTGSPANCLVTDGCRWEVPVFQLLIHGVFCQIMEMEKSIGVHNVIYLMIYIIYLRNY